MHTIFSSFKFINSYAILYTKRAMRFIINIWGKIVELNSLAEGKLYKLSFTE